MVLHDLSIVFAPSSFMFFGMSLTLMLCIITFARFRRKIVAINTFLTQKSFDFRIFLLLSLLILKTIILLKHLIPCMFFRASSVLTMFELRANVTTFVALILCTHFVSCFPLIHTINSTSLVGRRFEDACSTFILIATCAIDDKPCAIFAHVPALYVRFSILFTLSS